MRKIIGLGNFRKAVLIGGEVVIAACVWWACDRLISGPYDRASPQIERLHTMEAVAPADALGWPVSDQGF